MMRFTQMTLQLQNKECNKNITALKLKFLNSETLSLPNDNLLLVQMKWPCFLFGTELTKKVLSLIGSREIRLFSDWFTRD